MGIYFANILYYGSIISWDDWSHMTVDDRMDFIAWFHKIGIVISYPSSF